MPPDRGQPPKRKRRPGQGSGVFENNHSVKFKLAPRLNQGGRPGAGLLRVARDFLAPRRGGR
jgi:hypothetical protein